MPDCQHFNSHFMLFAGKLKEQLTRSAQTDDLVRELYVENANLMEALYVTEKRQKKAELQRFSVTNKCESITAAYRKLVPAVYKAVSLGQTAMPS